MAPPILSRLSAAVAGAYGWGKSLFATVEYLVVAGGGSGGVDYGGGGGAGGFRTGTQALVIDTAYTITVGAGGASQSSRLAGNDGSDSVFDTTTSTGGGGGGVGDGTPVSSEVPGRNGG